MGRSECLTAYPMKQAGPLTFCFAYGAEHLLHFSPPEAIANFWVFGDGSYRQSAFGIRRCCFLHRYPRHRR